MLMLMSTFLHFYSATLSSLVILLLGVPLADTFSCAASWKCSGPHSLNHSFPSLQRESSMAYSLRKLLLPTEHG